MYINIYIFVGLFAGIIFTTLEGVYGTNHTVSWKISDNQSVYRDSGHGSNFLVGDILVFRMEDEKDLIARVTSKSEYEACTAEGSKVLLYNDGEGIELNTSGSWYFISRISDHCKSGEKVLITVDERSVVTNQSSRMGRGGGSGGGGGGGGGGGSGGGGGGGSGNEGGFVTPKGNRDRPDKSAAAAALTSPFFIVLLALYSVLLGI
ncbi:hypothetical protein SUGI_1191750 [Cryptomeria japonica]|uniref:early nodulin-like protein 21 n=1 Tax=Cryptomeria japonica TaxID=3369 RepID=UPI0024146F1F|nr:early nodulin-like protein 21 [Cryptomeria japonica]GLJ55502.1 hypothetical protein SUGI_1191750 [Cryptomeria japonica]